MTYPHLARAPITEALVDLRVDLPPDVSTETLMQMQAALAESYPTKRDRLHWQVQFNPQERAVASEETKQTGFIFWSSDERRAVQARLDGFSFSWLKPYEDWAALRDEARRTWTEFVRIARPLRVTRVALRYINRIELKRPVDFNEYLVTFPRTQSSAVPTPTGLFMRLVSAIPEGTLVVTEAIDELGSTDQIIPVILDIDIFREGLFDVDGHEAWPVLEVLRGAKNRVFFGSVTPKALELFK
jgi:uncharacterized protein (TIGR04255 family)